MPPKKPTELSLKGLLANPMTFLILCAGSMTPFGQYACSKLFGMTTTTTELEAIKSATEQNKTQIERVDGKVSILIVEMERLRMERARTAQQ